MITPMLDEVLKPYVPTADELTEQSQYIVDGTLLPCWSWSTNPELYSGKHKTTGMNIQIACTVSGDLAWISDPINGGRHDMHCLSESGALTTPTLDHDNWIGDIGYIGGGMITPIRKLPHVTFWTGKTISTHRSTKSATSSNK